MTAISETASFVATMIFNLVLVGILISAGVSIALKLTRGASPRMRYLLVVISFLTAALLPFVFALIPVRNAPLSPVVESIENSHVTGNPITDVQSSGLDPVTFRPDSFDTVERILAPIQNSIARTLSNSSISIGVFTVWIIGTGVLLGREVSGHLGAARARRAWMFASRDIRQHLSWPRGIPLFIDNELGPCTLGAIRPAVVMPAHLIEGLSQRAARQVARHELEHLKWWDPSMNSLMRMIRACLWPSLPLWYLNRAACLEREAAADRAAIKQSSAELSPYMAALEYASTLLAIAKKRTDGQQYLLVATEAGRAPDLDARVRLLLAVPSGFIRARLFLAALALLASGSALSVLPIAKVPSQNNQTMSDGVRSSQLANNPELGALRVDEGLREGLVSSPAGISRGERLHRSSPTKEADKSRSASAINDELTVPISTAAAARETPTPTSALATSLAAQNFETQMAAVGYENLSPRQIADMKAYAVSPAYVAEMVDSGYAGLSADMLIRFKWLAVSSAFIREMKALGYANLNPRTLADFRQQGVSSTYIREMRALVSGPISAEQLVSLRFQGASTEFVHQIRALGYERVTADQLITMRLQGVTVAFIEDLKLRGLKELSLDRLISMRMRRDN